MESQELKELRNDVTEIKECLLSNEKYGRIGLVQQIKINNELTQKQHESLKVHVNSIEKKVEDIIEQTKLKEAVKVAKTGVWGFIGGVVGAFVIWVANLLVGHFWR